jgi:hypothetical protein
MQQGGFMRVRALVMMFALFSGAPAFAQTAVPELHPFGLDPYKPSDAALLRSYGGTLLAQTPLLELRQLDPYKPSDANLLRQLGNGIPQWSHFSWYPGTAAPAPLMMPSTPPPMRAASPTGPAAGNVVVRPLPPLPVPPPPPQRAPGSVPGGPVRASNAPVHTPEEAVRILRGPAYNTGQLEAAANDAVRTTEP